MKKGNLHTVFAVLLLFCGNIHAQNAGFLSRGNEYYGNSDYEKAITAYGRAIEEDENPAMAWFNKGNAHYQMGNMHKAVSCYQMATLEAPDFLRGWTNLGVIYHEMGDYGASVAALERVLGKSGSQDVLVMSVLASSYKNLHNFSKAAVYLEKVFEMDSTVSDAVLLLYEIAVMTGDNREALRWLSNYPESGSRRYDVLLIKGELMEQMGDTAGALAAFRQCTRISPERMRGWIALVNNLKEMDAVYTALLEAESALKINESFIPLALVAGRIAFEVGFYERAEFFFGLAYNAGHPEGVVGLSNLINVHERYSDYASVVRVRSIFTTQRENKPHKEKNAADKRD
ncbi:TPR domain protein, putative component of TonB system [Chitinispirillum alkaliphilum]|nr:TPR domain protein, putative component of TonB system [Chitinispirillum alkaliphilum]